MPPRFSQPVDWKNCLQLRTVTGALRSDLHRELGRATRGRIDGAELKAIFETVYQHQALEILEALTHYAPGNYGFTVGRTPDGQRTFKFPEFELAVAGLCPDRAAIQLGAIVEALETLLRNVPED